eukprot:CAMPEP_0197556288 /NCGR_PEP_ID=MMETSP1320-20131121/14891_1 /TAXON_ID=91990 /ORGANISM="Bolidomonas sp., Strain RCC2347" /LENGTH=61 /DNA_ID=CAMNT_0043117403 /DNA_START=178 /DNA_END=360 /DNA_ORIENTATION=-
MTLGMYFLSLSGIVLYQNFSPSMISAGPFFTTTSSPPPRATTLSSLKHLGTWKLRGSLRST